MATVDELVLRIKADATALEREMKRAGVIVGQQGKKMESGFGGIRNSLKGLQFEFGNLSGVIGGVIGAVGVREIARYSDAWTQAQNRLKLVTSSTAELASVSDKLFDISQDTYTGLGPTIALYQRLSFATKGLGVEQAEVLKFTEQLNKQLLVGGLSATEASTSIFQLTQAFNKGKLDGDEFRTILESAPPILEALQASLNKTKGEILAMSAAGELGPRELIDAVNDMADVTDARFKDMTFTIEQSMTRLDNAFTRFIGQSEDVSAVSGAVSESINFLAENIDEVGRVALSVAAIFSARLAVGLAASLALMGPMTLAIGALVGGFTYLATGTSKTQERQAELNTTMSRARELAAQLEEKNRELVRSSGDRAKSLRQEAAALKEKNLVELQSLLLAVQAEETRLKLANAAERRLTSELSQPGGAGVLGGLIKHGKLDDVQDDQTTRLRRIGELYAEINRIKAAINGGAGTPSTPTGGTEQSVAIQRKENDELKKQADILGRETVDALRTVEDQSIKTVRVMQDHFGDALEDLIFNFENFGDGVANVFEGIARDIARQQFINPLTSSISGALLGSNPFGDFVGPRTSEQTGLLGSLFSSFGGFFADGGTLKPGQWGIAGERGPEPIFAGNTPLQITSNRQATGGSGVTVVQNFHISPGVPALIAEEIRKAAPVIAAQAQQGVFASIERGGSAAAMVGRRN